LCDGGGAGGDGRNQIQALRKLGEISWAIVRFSLGVSRPDTVGEGGGGSQPLEKRKKGKKGLSLGHVSDSGYMIWDGCMGAWIEDWRLKMESKTGSRAWKRRRVLDLDGRLCWSAVLCRDQVGQVSQAFPRPESSEVDVTTLSLSLSLSLSQRGNVVGFAYLPCPVSGRNLVAVVKCCRPSLTLLLLYLRTLITCSEPPGR
jgi:hypothetical protein